MDTTASAFPATASNFQAANLDVVAGHSNLAASEDATAPRSG